MHSIKYIFFFLILLPGLGYAEQQLEVEIGDPKELFLTKRPYQSSGKAENNKRDEPKNFDEFLVLLKRDFGQFSKDLKKMKKEMEKQKRHSYHDSDFTPPVRPDWR